jgi:hypothetical protein
MAFDPDAYLAAKAPVARNPGQSLSDLPKSSGTVPEFNPDAYLAAKTQSQEATPQMGGFLDRAQTQLESFGNTVSANYLPQLQAAHEMLMGDPNAEVDAKLKAEGFTLNQPESSYVNMRDENIARQQAQAQRNPYDAVAGTLGGMAVTTPIISAGTVALNGGKLALTGIQRLKDSARLGATLGLVSNPGDTEGVVSPLQAMDRLKNTGTGGAIGAAGQVAGDAVSKTSEAVKAAPKLLEKVGNITAVKALGALPRDLKKLFGSNNAHEIGDTVLKRNLIGSTIEETAQNAKVAKTEIGKRMGGILDATHEELTNPENLARMSAKDRKLLDITKNQLSGERIADKAESVINRNLENNLASPDIKAKVKNTLDQLRSKKDPSLLDLQEMKVNLDKEINYNKELKDAPEVQKQFKVIRDMINDKMESRVRVLGKVSKNKDLIKEYKGLKREYGHVAKAESIASNRAKEIEGHRWLSLSENLAGGTGATIGAMTGDSPEEKFRNAIVGFAAGAATKKADKFLTPAVAKSAKRLSLLMKTPANFAKYTEPLMEAAKRSPEEFQALVNQFGKDPEFKKLQRANP